jgi:hypothetical protein
MKDAASLAKKFVTRASAAAPDYVDGVKVAGQDWQSNALAAEDNYGQATTQAIADKRFGKGIAKAGGAYYSERAATIGGNRYAPGVQAAGNNWSEGASPYLEIARQPLSIPRRPKGQNAGRANEMAERMRALKLSR